MRTFPVDLNAVLALMMAVTLPMLPLLRTVYRFDDLVLKLFGLF
jgi:hypothetical protein